MATVEIKVFYVCVVSLGLGWRNHGGRESHVHFGFSIDTESKGGRDTSSR